MLSSYLVRSMANRSWMNTVGFLIGASVTLVGQNNKASSGSWSGVVINGNCSADEAFAESAKCTEKRAPGEKLSLYDDTTRLVYDLDRQDQAADHLGDSVIVAGALQGNTIHVASIKLLTAIGLAEGRKAPAFSARDQFGREQNLDSLKGSNGTVLLFFRSADW